SAPKRCRGYGPAAAMGFRMHRTGKRARELSRLDERLDAALNETFPASDPIAVGRPTATEPPPARGEARTPVADAAKAAARPPADRRAGHAGKAHAARAQAARAHGAKVRGP